MGKKAELAVGLLMPKATAVWLVENTALTFEQIANFTGLHAVEVQALADEDVGVGIVGRDPVEHGELAQEELDKASADSSYNMIMSKSDLPSVKIRAKGPRYTPVSKRGDKPDAIAYLLKHNQEISDAQITRLIGTTKTTINNVRDRTHPNSSNIKPRHPVDLGLCTYAELEAASNKGYKAQGKDPEEMKRQKEAAAAAKLAEEQETDVFGMDGNNDPSSGFDFSNFLSSDTDSVSDS
jgi:hypothetical protein